MGETITYHQFKPARIPQVMAGVLMHIHHIQRQDGLTEYNLELEGETTIGLPPLAKDVVGGLEAGDLLIVSRLAMETNKGKQLKEDISHVSIIRKGKNKEPIL